MDAHAARCALTMGIGALQPLGGPSPGGGTATWCPRRGCSFLSNLSADFGHAEKATPPRGEPGLRRPPEPRSAAIPPARSRCISALTAPGTAPPERSRTPAPGRGNLLPPGHRSHRRAERRVPPAASALRGGGKGSRRAPSAHPGAGPHPPPRPCLHYLPLHVRAASPRGGRLAPPVLVPRCCRSAPRPPLRRCPAALPRRDGLCPQRSPLPGSGLPRAAAARTAVQSPGGAGGSVRDGVSLTTAPQAEQPDSTPASPPGSSRGRPRFLRRLRPSGRPRAPAFPPWLVRCLPGDAEICARSWAEGSHRPLFLFSPLSLGELLPRFASGAPHRSPKAAVSLCPDPKLLGLF